MFLVRGRGSEKVVVLVIEHQYGDDIYVCQTNELAHRKLDAYVREWWSHEMERPMPKKSDDRVSQYFQEMGENRGQEFYTLRETTMLEK